MKELVHISIRWDGSAMLIGPTYSPAWRELVGPVIPAPRVQRYDIGDLDDIDSFALEVALYNCARDIGGRWEDARRQQAEDRAAGLFGPLKRVHGA